MMGARLVQQLCELQILAALLQLTQWLQELDGRGNTRQITLAHHILDYAPHIQVARRRLGWRRQGCPALPPRLCLHATQPHGLARGFPAIGS